MTRVAPFAAAVGAAAVVVCTATLGWTEGATTKIGIANNEIGASPSDFELSQTGEGERGQWMVVHDPTAVEGVAIEHRSTDPHDDRFPLAIHKPLSLENVEASVRFKIISGTMQAAGLAVCLRNHESYYAVSASVLEQRVDLLLFAKGQVKRIESAEADVVRNRWQTLRLIVNDDHFTVSLDDKVMFVTFDRARRKDGRIALWTQEDNITRFDQVEIRPSGARGQLMPYSMKPLSCDPTKIKGMSERLIISHYENNYGGAVKRLNLIDEQLTELDYAKAAGFLINGLKREQLIAMNSMILHELFFDGLGDESAPSAPLRDTLARDFGSFERWRSEFVAMGKALGGGSGWVLLSWSPRDRKLVNQWASDHCHTLAGGTPILALDMYEHSYHMDFGAKAASYVDTFMEVIRWNNVERLFVQMTRGQGTGGAAGQ